MLHTSGMADASDIEELARAAEQALPASKEDQETLLASLLHTQRSLQGTLSFSTSELGSIIGARLRDDEALVDSSTWNWDELLITNSALQGRKPALQLVESMLRETAHAALKSRGFSPSEIEEVIQQLLVKLLTADGDTGPRLELYSGRGSLVGFVRSAVVRAALNNRRGELRHKRLAYAQHVEGVLDDPALVHLKQNYLQRFRKALASAMAALPADKKLALRLQLEDKLTIDDLARLWGVHRATAARRLVSARNALAAATRAELKEELSLDDDAVESVMHLIRSRLGDAVSALS